MLSLGGVLLGGGLTVFTQRATQRSAERLERLRQTVATAEARRTEQVQAIKEFMSCAQLAEGAAYHRPERWGEDEGWMVETRGTMDRLWTADRTVVRVGDPGMRAPVRDYGRALNQAVWREVEGMDINEHLEPHKEAFMAAARASLAER